MRLATVRTASGPRLQVRGATGYVDVGAATGNEDLSTLDGLLAAGPAAAEAVADLTGRNGIAVAEADLAPAVPRPRRVLCLGVNYAEHAAETGRQTPSWPESFPRSEGSVVGPYDDLVRPALSDKFDFEGELGLVIGAGGRYIPAEKALSAIFGFTVLNDASARDWQRAGTQWLPGKNFEGSMPIGPEIVTVDEVGDDLAITTTLNGEVMQSARTSQMIVGIERAVEFFSSFTTLRPGDVIATGTPGGVGLGRRPQIWLAPGDLIEVEVEGVGRIANRVVAEQGAPADWPWAPPPLAVEAL